MPSSRCALSRLRSFRWGKDLERVGIKNNGTICRWKAFLLCLWLTSVKSAAAVVIGPTCLFWENWLVLDAVDSFSAVLTNIHINKYHESSLDGNAVLAAALHAHS